METIRKIDTLGRIVIPQHIRQQLNILEGDDFKISVVNGVITVAPHAEICKACGDDTDVKQMGQTFLCGECRGAIEGTLPKAI